MSQPFSSSGEIDVTTVEARLAYEAARVLGSDPARLPPDRPLTALGLDSLAAVELATAIEEATGIAVSLGSLLAGASLATLAAEVAAGQAAARGAAAAPASSPASPPPEIEAGPPLGEQPLSAGQEALWFSDRLAPRAAAYNLAAAVRIAGRLDPAALGRALQSLTDRHPALRTTFTFRNGEPRQIVHAHLAADFQVEESPGPGGEEGGAGAARGAAEGEGPAGAAAAGRRPRAAAEPPLAAALPLAAEALRPFDVAGGPLLRVRLWRVGGDEPAWVLLLAVHHLVSDFWSLGVLARELGALYGEAAGGAPAALAALPFAFADHVRWQARELAGERGERLWDYWRETLAGELPVLALPADRPRPAVASYAGVARGLRLAPEVADRLRAVASASGTTLFVTLLTGFQVFLGRYTGQDEVVVGTPTAGRGAAPFRQVMGYFVNPVALRLAGGDGGGINGAGEPTWRELLAAAQRVAGAAFEHQALPFATIAARLRPERDPGRSPLFQTLFVFQQAARHAERGLAELALGDGGGQIRLADLTLAAVPIGERRALFDLSLLAADGGGDGGDGLPLVLELNRDLFDAATAERMVAHLANLLTALAAEPGASAAAAEMLSPAERRQLAAWNDTGSTLDSSTDVCLPHLVAAQAARTPRRVALVAGEAHFTYEDLARRVAALASELRAAGVVPEVRVGVATRRSADAVAALLAVHEAGGAYVPLDPLQPATRLAWMLADSGAALLLVEETFAPALRTAGLPEACRVLYLEPLLATASAPRPESTAPVPQAAGAAPAPRPEGASPAAPAGAAAMGGAGRGGGRVRPENLAYLIYTSGSTGRPKGVAITHQSAVALVRWARRAFSDEELGGMLASTSFGFDLSVFEIFAPLCWGGRIVLADNALALGTLPAAAAVRVLNTVPSLLAELLRAEGSAGGLPASLTTVALAGEALPRGLVRAVRRALPDVRLLNLYGPTEDTTYSTWTEVPRQDEERPPSIGRPLPGGRAHLLDRRMRQVPVGVTAEIHLAGDGLARGYHGRPDLTAERFVPDPFAAGQRLYRTGDLGRLRPDGELDIFGRIDHQVKIRGVRIEPGEVEAALLSLPAVHEAAVLVQPAPHLFAWVVAAAGAAPEAAALRESLLPLLPRAMIPTTIVLLPSLPLTASGKVDRQALARLAAERTADADGAGDPGGEPAPPRTPVEELLAGIWSEVLGVERVGSGDDFFDLGGHSLLALRVQARVRDRLGVELPLAAFFQLPTLAAQARGLARGTADPRPPLRRAPTGQTLFPLSFAQARLWLLERLRPGTAVYHMAGAARLDGPLSVPALRRAFAAVIARHEALRTRYREIDGEPMQEIAPLSGPAPAPAAARAATTGGTAIAEAAIVAATAATAGAAATTVAAAPLLPLVCLAGLDGARRASEAERLSRTVARRPFDLARQAPMRQVLVRLGPQTHQLLLTLHHIAADEDSLTILARELAALYVPAGAPPAADPTRSAQSEAPAAAAALPPLAPLALRYVDYALAERQWLSGAALESRLAWWRDHLADLPAVELPTDRPRPAARGARGAVAASALPPALGAALAALAHREGATLFMVLLAAFQAVLARTADVPEVPVGTPATYRDREPLLPMVGFLVNTLVLRARPGTDDPVDLADGERPGPGTAAGRPGGEADAGGEAHAGDDGPRRTTFRQLVRQARRTTLLAHQHGDVPFEVLVQALQPERGLGGNPFFEVVFALQRPPRGWQLGGLDFTPRTVATGTAKFELTLYAVDSEGALSFLLEHASEIYDRTSAARLLAHLEALLAGAAADPARPAAELPFLSPAERQQLREWGLAEQVDAAVLPAAARRLAGLEVRVLDSARRPVAAGTPGELYLAWPGIERGAPAGPDRNPAAAGSDRNPAAGGLDWSAERFVPDPSAGGANTGARLYRTGERVRFGADGHLHRYVPAATAAAEPPPPHAAATAGARPDGGGSPGDSDGVPTATFDIVAAIWQELLPVAGAVRPGDNFFALGGHSLLLLPIQERLRQRTGVDLPVVDLFKHRTAGALARHLHQLRTAAASAPPPIAADDDATAPRTAAAPPDPIVPLPAGAGNPPASFVQEQLWFIDRLEPGSPVYNLPTAVRLDGELDRAALRRALADLVARQAVLRTTLASDHGRAVQVVAARLVPRLAEIDLAALPAAAAEAAAARLLASEALAPFDLAAGPLFRATLLRLTADRHRLLVTFHHTITDGWSLRLFYEELGALYAAHLPGGADPGLSALPVQYADYAPWQRRRLAGERLAGLLAYWRQRLAGAPPLLDLPGDQPRPPVQRYHGISELLDVDPRVAEALRAFAHGEGATLFMTLVAAYATLLHRSSGETDLVLGTPAANRWPAELEGVLGFFANTLPLRLDLAGDPPFRELVGRVRGAVLADLAHQEVPFEKIVEELRPRRDLSHNPIYQVVFALETSPRPYRLDLPGLTLTPLPPVEGTAKFDLALYLGDHGGRLGGLLEANRDLVDRPTAVRWLRHFTALAAAAAAEPARRLSQIPFLAPAEQQQLLAHLAAAGQRVTVDGYRVDLGRIERRLAEHPGVAAAAVAVRADRSGTPRLMACHVPPPGAAPAAGADLRAFLAERLPEHLLPAVWVPLAALPRTAGGELDRDALPAAPMPDAAAAAPAAAGGDPAALPADAMEQVVVEVWRELLGIAEVGPADNFFALGGRSLLLLPMQEELERRCGVRIPVVDLFKFPSAGALARRLGQAAANAAPPPSPPAATPEVRERAERTLAAVGQNRFADARRRMEEAAKRPER